MSIENADIPDTWSSNRGYISGLAAHGIGAEVTDSWAYSPRMRPEQVRLIQQHGAEEALSLRQESADRWVIQLNMVRVVGRKRGSPPPSAPGAGGQG